MPTSQNIDPSRIPVDLAVSPYARQRSTHLIQPGTPLRHLDVWTRVCWFLLAPLLGRAHAHVALQIVAFVILGGLGVTLLIRLAELIAQAGRAHSLLDSISFEMEPLLTVV